MGGGGEEVKVLGMYDGNEVTTGVIGMGFPFVWVGRDTYLYIRLDRIYKPLLSACLIIHFREDMVVEAEGYAKLPSCPSYHGGTPGRQSTQGPSQHCNNYVEQPPPARQSPLSQGNKETTLRN